MSTTTPSGHEALYSWDTRHTLTSPYRAGVERGLRFKVEIDGRDAPYRELHEVLYPIGHSVEAPASWVEYHER